MSEKTTSLHRAEIEQAIDDLVEDAILTPWDTRSGQYLRLQIHIARAYLAFLDKHKQLRAASEKAKPKKVKSKRRRTA